MRYKDGGRRRGRGRSRYLTILGDISAGKVNYNKEGVWTTGRLNMYFLCANANKIYLDALWRRHAALPADYSRKCLRVQNACRMCLPRDIPVMYSLHNRIKVYYNIYLEPSVTFNMNYKLPVTLDSNRL